MSETSLNFGPEWIRALTTNSASGATNNVTSLPIQRYTLAEFRYGREEMLALLPKEPHIPKSLQEFPELLREKFQLPLALIPQTEEEQRLWGRSVNSDVALRAKAGYRPGGRGGSVDRGRGRGRGGYQDDGFVRPKVERSLSASEKEHRWDDRERRFDRTYPTQREDNVRGPGENWRKFPKEDDADWRFRSTGGRSWRREDRPRSAKWKEDSQQGNLPEWSFEETAEPEISFGTFDSSGAFLETETKNKSKDEVYASDDANEGLNKSPEAKPKEASPVKSLSSKKSPKAPPPSQPTPDRTEVVITRNERVSPDEDAFAHHQKATENMVAQWTEEIEKSPSKQHPPPQPKPHQDKEVHWFYSDPQGKIQGPFLSSDMLDWYTAGYFTQNLMVRRTFDEKFTQLGDLIDSWGRIPFLPGDDSPPPLRSEASAPPKPQDDQLLAIQQQLFQQQLVQQQLLLRQAQMQTLLTQLNKQDTFTNLTQQQQQVLMQQLLAQAQMPRPDMLEPLPLMGLPVPQMMKNNLWPSATWSAMNLPEALQPPTSNSIWDLETPDKEEDSQSKLRRLAEQELHKKDEAEELRKQKEEQQRAEERKMLEELKRQREEECKRLEELKRIEEEAERKRLEEIKKQQEEELRKQQEELKRLEEVRRQQEKIRKQEELRQKQEELRRLEELKKQQEELKRQEEIRRQEELKIQQEEMRKHQEEMRRQQEELQKQEELRKQEEKRKKDEMLAILRQKELERQRRVEEEEAEKKRIADARIQKGPVWGTNSSQPNPPEMSLADIQRLQEEKEREERDEKTRKQLMQQKSEKQVQQTKNKLSWAKRANDGSSSVKSLTEIQQEEAERLAAQAQQKPQPPTPPVNIMTAGVWGNSSHLNKITSNMNCVSIGGGFWDDVPAPKKQPQRTGNESAFPTLVNPVQHPVTNSNKNKNLRSKKDEDAVARLFTSHHKPTDEFTKWCMNAISAMPSSVDVPTFVAFLKDIDSPYEVYDYVKSYFGEGKDQREFAKLFLEKRSQFRNKAKQPPAEDNSLWGPAPAITPHTNKPPTGGSDNTGAKAKKRKNRMQRLDSSLLGFTVQSNPDRINVGEIDHAQ